MSIVSPILRTTLGAEEVLLAFPFSQRRSALGIILRCYLPRTIPTCASVTRSSEVLANARMYSDKVFELSTEQAEAICLLLDTRNKEFCECNVRDETALLKILFGQSLPEQIQLQLELGH